MAKTKSKTRTFVVPKEFLASFFQELENSDLDFELDEIDEDKDLCVKVEYSSEQREAIMNLIELEDEFYEEQPVETEQEEEED